MGHRIGNLWWEGTVGREELRDLLNECYTGILDKQLFLIWIYSMYYKTFSISGYQPPSASIGSHL